MYEIRMAEIKLIFGYLLLYASITPTHAADTISANQIVRYNETIISSPLETFELGFFNPGNSTNHYVGIWYKKISPRTVVWVANRNTPLTDTSVELTLTHQGVLIIQDATTGNIVWSSANSTTLQVRKPIGQVLDTGNFIIYEEGDRINEEDPIWQSFDFITDTLLPGMKMGWNLVTRTESRLTSWKSDDDPAFGPWNGLRFSGISNLRSNPFYNFTFVVNQREIYYQVNLIDTSVITRLVIQPTGNLERWFWMDSKQEWNLYLSRQNDRCDQYAVCGPFGSCNIGRSPVCECLKGFEPASPDQWKITDWSQGCRHTVPLDCNPGEGFNKYSNLKLPDTRGSWKKQQQQELKVGILGDQVSQGIRIATEPKSLFIQNDLHIVYDPGLTVVSERWLEEDRIRDVVSIKRRRKNNKARRKMSTNQEKNGRSVCFQKQ
ncbi:hypothetical protein L1987_85025 [Smallanthus sonchifolius]|uniref:Uncharacterized protein n=1 Tax=Smallanthus sonchifolius TaxID=185202 RepID=A0ACB8XVE1_9ASTR|nr:hypothetical protein L1987_85025 [Smallanthus sonchifolius]